MKIDDLNKCFDAVAPSESCKERMLYNVLSSKNTVKTGFLTLKRCSAVLAAVVFIAGISYGYTKLNNLGVNKIVANVTEDTDNSENNGAAENKTSVNTANENIGDAVNSSEKSSESINNSDKASSVRGSNSEERAIAPSKKAESNTEKSKQEPKTEGDKSLEKNIIVAQADVIENGSPMIARSMPQEDNAASGGGGAQAKSSEVENEISVASAADFDVDLEEEEDKEDEKEEEDEEKDEITSEEEAQTAE